MNREEIEKLIEETVQKENAKRKSFSIDQTRNVLNILFLNCATIGVVLYFVWPENRLVGIGTVGVGMVLKTIEFFLRFLF